MSRAEIVVDVAAVRHNVRRLGDLTATPVMVVVKADGYGHGMLACARAAREAGAPWLGVATLDEALALRDDGDAGLLLCWLTVPGDDLMPAVVRGVDITAYTVTELDRIAEAAARAGRRARVQLKIDTGLSRGGSTAADWPALVARARAGEEDGAWTVTGIWSHFASSEVPEDPANEAQEKLFREALDVTDEAGLRPEVRHLANSAAAILRPSSRFDLVRCGIASYGLDPAPGLTPPELDLRPAMTVRADLALVKHVEAGAAVSYNGLWVAPEPTTLGLVPVGYADGILRSAANRGEVLVGGRRRPIRGNVCMDQVVVDLDGDEPEPGDPVVLFGPGTAGEPTAQDWAEATGTISYEIVTRVGGRLVRRTVDSDVEPGVGGTREI
ncbi:alanine racemase [Nocardioides sp. AN3]